MVQFPLFRRAQDGAPTAEPRGTRACYRLAEARAGENVAGVCGGLSLHCWVPVEWAPAQGQFFSACSCISGWTLLFPIQARSDTARGCLHALWDARASGLNLPWAPLVSAVEGTRAHIWFASDKGPCAPDRDSPPQPTLGECQCPVTAGLDERVTSS